MDTILGLSITPTTVGWVLAEGHGAEGAILDHRELELRDGGGVPAVAAAEQVVAEVGRVKAVAAAHHYRVHGIGMTWSDEASAQAALLVESLMSAGFDNIVPVRCLDAAEAVAQALAPAVGYEKTAVCILEREWATVVMVDTRDGETQTATKHVRGGFDGLTCWLTGMFERSAWRPAGVVVVGSDSNIDSFSWQLENILPVPVFTQTMAQVTVARGAVLVAAQRTGFTDAGVVTDTSELTMAPSQSRQWSYTGAVAALVAAVVIFVTSLSLAVGLQLVSDNEPGASAHPVRKSTTSHLAEAMVSAAQPAGLEGRQPAWLTSGGLIAELRAPQEQSNVAALPQDPGNGSLLLTRVLQHIPGMYGESASRTPE